MKTKAAHIAQYSIRIFLMVFWLYVALDKLWDLEAFHRALLRQPFPDWWADVLYWSLPLAELGIAISFVRAKNHVIAIPKKNPDPRHHVTLSTSSSSVQSLSKGLPFLFSALLLLIFTIYIALGVAGFYAQRPCGCASVFSGLSWEWHLVVNVALVGLSILGWYLSEPTAPTDSNGTRYKKFMKLFLTFTMLLVVPIYDGIFFIRRRFPKRFAPFPGRPVSE